MLKDGTYFNDAVEWYLYKYVFIFTQRASMLLLGAIISVGLIISLEAARTNFGKTTVPFPIYAKDQVNFVPLIKPLAHNNDTIEIAVARYFVAKYVELREGYNSFEFTEENKSTIFSRIRALSSHFVYRGYEDFINPDINIESPIIRYKNQVSRVITIDDIQIKGAQDLPDSALITFTATESNSSGATAEQYAAEISFIMSDLGKVFDKKSPLYFVVTKYKTYKLSK